MFPEGALFCLLPSCDRNLEDIGYHYCKSNGNDDDQRGSSQAHNRTLEHKENQRSSYLKKINNLTEYIFCIYLANGTSKIFKCYNCGKEGHLSNNCSSKPNQNSNTNNVNNRKNANTNNQSGNFKGKNFNKITSKSFNQGNSKNNSNYANNGNNMNNYKNNNSNNEVGIKCFKCGSEGHYANKCPNQNLNTPNNYGQITFQNSNNNVVGFENPAVKCYKCGQAGHYASTCTSNNSNANNQNINRKDFSQNNLNNYNNNKNINDKTVLKCFKCNQPGHFAPNCPLNIIPSNSNFPKNNNINYNNNNDNNVSKRNYNQSKIFKEKKSCEICGVKRHNKNSNCPGMKKNKKNKLTFKNENDQNSSSDDE